MRTSHVSLRRLSADQPSNRLRSGVPDIHARESEADGLRTGYAICVIAEFAGIREIFRTYGYDAELRDGGERLYAWRSRSPFVMNAVLNKGKRSAFFYVHLYIRGQIGERSDELVVYSSMLGCTLRFHAGVSVSIIPVAHPAVFGEIGDIFVRVDQPNGSWYPIDQRGLEQLTGVIATVSRFSGMLAGFLDWTPLPSNKCECGFQHAVDSCEPLREIVRGLLRCSPDALGDQRRVNPNWEFVYGKRLFVIKSAGVANFVYAALSSDKVCKTVKTTPGWFFRAGEILHFIGAGTIREGRRLLRGLQSEHTVNLGVVPMENVVLFCSRDYVLGLSSDAGLNRYRREQSRFARQYRDAVEVIFPALKIDWTTITDEDLEALTYDLLDLEPGVNWVRRIGSTRDRDAGRDLLAEMSVPGTPISGSEILPLNTATIIVQCKAFGGSVGKRNVPDIRDTIEHHGASGYLLVVSSTVTSALVDHLLALRRRFPFVDWWTKRELERRIVAHPEIISKWKHVISCKL